VKTFFDSSAFAKRYLEEAGSSAVEALCLAASDLAVCVICVPEILSALNRRVRERHILSSDYLLLKGHLLDDLRDAAIVDLTPAVIAGTVEVLEAAPLRAADAMHVAAALAWDADLFVSADHRQLAAARAAGLEVKPV
jgi:predicted nucleic acid-binding protein